MEASDSVDDFQAVLLISDKKEQLFSEKIIQVVPRRYVLGIGARKALAFPIIKQEYLNFCELNNVHYRSIKEIVSIELKKVKQAYANWPNGLMYRLQLILQKNYQLFQKNILNQSS